MHRHTHHIKVNVLVTLETQHQSGVLWDWGFWLLITTSDLRDIWKIKRQWVVRILPTRLDKCLGPINSPKIENLNICLAKEGVDERRNT